MDKHTEQVTVLRAKRAGSAGGSPVWEIHTDKGVYLTAKQAQCAYTVDNDFRSDEPVNIPVTLELDKSGRVTGWTL